MSHLLFFSSNQEDMGDQAGTESETERLASLLSEWREPGALVRVRPILVVPDATNREVRSAPTQNATQSAADSAFCEPSAGCRLGAAAFPALASLPLTVFLLAAVSSAHATER